MLTASLHRFCTVVQSGVEAAAASPHGDLSPDPIAKAVSIFHPRFQFQILASFSIEVRVKERMIRWCSTVRPLLTRTLSPKLQVKSNYRYNRCCYMILLRTGEIITNSVTGLLLLLHYRHLRPPGKFDPNDDLQESATFSATGQLNQHSTPTVPPSAPPTYLEAITIFPHC